MKANFFILCGAIFLVRLQGKFEIDPLLGVTGSIHQFRRVVAFELKFCSRFIPPLGEAAMDLVGLVKRRPHAD